MNRWTVLLGMVILLVLLCTGCSSGDRNPSAPDTQVGMTSDTAWFEQNPAKTYLLGYFDCQLDVENKTIEIVPNRTVDFTLNLVPFLNKMNIPKYGITFDSVAFHQDDPSFLGVDVEFSIYHPFPGYDQYQGYDVMGVVIGDGSSTLDYQNLRVAEHGMDLYMTNADGYTRWFNPSEFTTELIFGWAPGGYQNFEGNATLNPYKYYAKHLEKDQDLWFFLTVGPNFDGVFENGVGRTMKLEFPMPDPGLKFSYAVVLAWEDEGDGPYHPYHRDEAVAAKITQTPDLYFNEIDGSGGDLILDIDLFAWKKQPTTIRLESGVLQNVMPFNAATYASPGGENYSTYHIEIQSDPFVGTDHEAWVIAEYPQSDYSNKLVGVPHGEGPLASFFRIPLTIAESPYNQPPECDLTSDPGVDYEGPLPVTITFDANGYDPEGGPLIYQWSENGTDWESDAVTKDYEYTTNGYYSVYVKVTDIEYDYTICSITDFLVNQPPECVLVSDPILPYSGLLPVDIEFDASGSFDPDGDAITFAWDTDDDGIFDDGSDPTVTVHYDTEGTYTVCVRVTDAYGAQCESCFDDFHIVEALDHPWPSWMGGDLNQCASKYVGYGDSTKSGTPKWVFPAEEQGEEGCVIASDGSIYFTIRNCALYGVNPDGSLKWEFKPLTPWVSFCPALDADGYVYTCMGSPTANYLYKVDPVDGSQVWSCYLSATPCYASSPSIGHDGSVYVTYSSAYDSGYIQQVHPDGTKGWSYWIPASSYSNPWQLGTAILPNGNIIATGGTWGKILCFEPEGGGTPLWEYQHSWWILHTPAVGPQGNIYFTDYEGFSINAIDENGDFLWDYNTSFYMWASPAIDPNTGNVFVGDRLGHFRCFSPDGDGAGNGEVLWDHVFASTGIDGTAAIDANGDVYVAVGHQPGAPFVGLVKMDGDNGDILWQSDDLGYLVTHAPSIGADGTIFMTGHYAASALYAWGD
ncbi:MAG: PKD domain-containing protein [bacterium]|nr:PKD domain-containing protein [bacterium]